MFTDKYGVDIACLLPESMMDTTGYSGRFCSNGEMAKAVEKHPDRFMYHPNISPVKYRGVKNTIWELEYWVKEKGAKIFKFYPPEDTYINNPDLWPFYETAEKLGIVLCIHTGMSWVPPGKSKYRPPIQLDDVARDFPQLKIVAFHMGYPYWSLARLPPNIFLRSSSVISGYPYSSWISLVNWKSRKPTTEFFKGPPEMTRRLFSVGREQTLVTAKVVNENGKEVVPGEIGEIVANPEQTAETLKNGWLHTGDMGTVDEAGYIYLVDRKKDMIITGGENVYPKEVEDVLYEHPAVFEVAVIGVPDEKWGEAVKAVVVLKEGLKIEEQELIKFTKSRLAGYKCPKSIDFTGVIPKTAVGKISRAEVKKHYWQGNDRLIN